LAKNGKRRRRFIAENAEHAEKRRKEKEEVRG
jgi:hypothetical protein